jgi:hypothetical protein
MTFFGFKVDSHREGLRERFSWAGRHPNQLSETVFTGGERIRQMIFLFRRLKRLHHADEWWGDHLHFKTFILLCTNGRPTLSQYCR